MSVPRGRWHAKGRKPGEMNGSERAYAERLTGLLAAGMIARWDFEPEKFKLAQSTFYTPDFRVLTTDGFIEFHEIKGFKESTGRVKIKVCAEMHPMYRFIQVTKKLVRDGGGWDLEQIV